MAVRSKVVYGCGCAVYNKGLKYKGSMQNPQNQTLSSSYCHIRSHVIDNEKEVCVCVHAGNQCCLFHLGKLGRCCEPVSLIKTDPRYDANTFHEKKIRSLHPILLLCCVLTRSHTITPMTLVAVKEVSRACQHPNNYKYPVISLQHEFCILHTHHISLFPINNNDYRILDPSALWRQDALDWLWLCQD